MKIGIDIRPLNGGRRSGVEGYIINLLESLFAIDQQNEYKLFYNSFKGNGAQELNFENYKNVKLYKFNYPNKILNWSFKYFKYPKIDKMLDGVDIFFEPNILFNALSNNCKNVLTFHDLSFITHPKYYSFKRRMWHRLINPKKLAQKADGIIAVSNSTKSDLVNVFNLDPDKINVIHSGIKEEKELNTDQLSKIKVKYEIPEKFILYLGVMEPRKNIISIISAFEKMKKFHKLDHKLVLAGSKGWLSAKIYKKIENSKFKDDIKYFGFVEEGQKKALYELADLFVFPSFYEGFGFPPLEAMMSMTPVITSSVSSLPEVCGKAAVYIDPYNVNELYQMMAKILKDEKLRSKLVEEGQDQVQKFKWEESARQTLKYFEEVNNKTI